MSPETTIPKRRGSSRESVTWLLVFAGLLLAIRVGFGLFGEKSPPAPADLVSWRAPGAGEAAARSGTAVMYDFTADWCPPCQAMKRDLFSDRASARAIESMVLPVRVLDRAREEGRNPPKVAELQARYRITGFPTLVVVGAPGTQPQVLEGYPGRQATLQWIRKAVIQVRGASPAPDSTRS